MLGSRVPLMHGRDTYAEDTATREGAWGVTPSESMPKSACRVMCLVFSPLARARSRLATAPHSRQKAVRGFLGEVVSRKNPQKCIYLSGKKGRYIWILLDYACREGRAIHNGRRMAGLVCALHAGPVPARVACPRTSDQRQMRGGDCSRHCQLNAKTSTFVQEPEEQCLVGAFMNPWIFALRRGPLCLAEQAAIRDFR